MNSLFNLAKNPVYAGFDWKELYALSYGINFEVFPLKLNQYDEFVYETQYEFSEGKDVHVPLIIGKCPNDNKDEYFLQITLSADDLFCKIEDNLKSILELANNIFHIEKQCNGVSVEDLYDLGFDFEWIGVKKNEEQFPEYDDWKEEKEEELQYYGS